MEIFNANLEKLWKTSIMVALSFGLLLTGCATTSPNAKFSETLKKEQYLDANDDATVEVEASNGIAIEQYEKQRLAHTILGKISEQKVHNVNSADKRELKLEVLITRYERGNSFARFMLAGLGQIHIDAKVLVFILPEQRKIAEFEIDKTFAWGGLYGGTTSIVDVEQGFAKGVAEAVTGTKEQEVGQ